MQPTYRVMNKRLMLCGCDRQVFLAGLFSGAGLFNATDSPLVGFITIAIFTVVAYFHAKDPTALRIFLNSRRYKAMYDPAKRSS